LFLRKSVVRASWTKAASQAARARGRARQGEDEQEDGSEQVHGRENQREHGVLPVLAAVRALLLVPGHVLLAVLALVRPCSSCRPPVPRAFGAIDPGGVCVTFTEP
jgi:hypothetical protein